MPFQRAFIGATILVVQSHGSIRDYMNIVIDSVPFSGLRQAVHVMDCLAQHRDEAAIAKSPGFDEQLVTMWVLFLHHNHWMSKTTGNWAVTPKGASWRSKLVHVQAA